MNEWNHWLRVDGRLIRDKNIYAVIIQIEHVESLRFKSLRLRVNFASGLRVTVVPSLPLNTAVIQHSRLSAIETMAKSNLSAVLRKVDDLCLVR